MRCAVSFVIFAFLAHGANSTSIYDIFTRIPQEQQFLQNQISSTKLSIQADISRERSSLNSRAENMKAEMKAGTSSCTVWISQIESIQQGYFNFIYYFRTCEKGTELVSLGNTKGALQEMQRTAEKVQAMCSLPGFNCQREIDNLSAGLDAIHNNVVREIGSIQSSSRSCIDGKVKESTNKLDGTYTLWNKCNASSN